MDETVTRTRGPSEVVGMLAQDFMARRVCEQTIRTEEHNLAALQVRRAQVALPATLGDKRARKEAEALERSEARIRRRLALARLALGGLS